MCQIILPHPVFRNIVDIRVNQEGGLHVLSRPQSTYFQIPIHLNFQPYIWITLEGKVYQLKRLFASAFLQLFTSSTKCLLWFLSGITGEGFSSFDMGATG